MNWMSKISEVLTASLSRGRVFLFLFFANGLSNLVQFLSSIVLARGLGPEEFGSFSFFVSFAQSLSLAVDLGLCATVVRLASASSTETHRQGLLHLTFFIQLLIYLALFSGLLILGAHVLQVFDQDQTQLQFYLLALLFTGAIAIQLLMKSVMQVYQALTLLAGFTLMYAILRATSFLWAYTVDSSDAQSLFAALYLYPLLLCCVLYALYSIIRYRLWRTLEYPSLSVMRGQLSGLFQYGKWMLAQPLYSLLYLVPVFLLASRSQAELGQYSAALAFSAVFSLFNTSIRQVTLPMVSRFTRQQEVRDYQAQVWRYLPVYLAFAVVVIVVMGVAMSWALGEQYARALPAFVALSTGMASTIYLGQINIVSHVYHRPDLLLKMTVAQALVLSLCCFQLTVVHGMGAFENAMAVAACLVAGEIWLFLRLRALSLAA